MNKEGWYIWYVIFNYDNSVRLLKLIFHGTQFNQTVPQHSSFLFINANYPFASTVTVQYQYMSTVTVQYQYMLHIQRFLSSKSQILSRNYEKKENE